MSSEQSGDALHLPDLFIENFRGIKSLTIPRLGRVTLLAGQNGVGKTTVLDAVKVYAARARFSVLQAILRSRDEISVVGDDDTDDPVEPDWEGLFYGWDAFADTRISIGPTGPEGRLEMVAVDLGEVTGQQMRFPEDRFPSTWSDDGAYALKVTFRGGEAVFPTFIHRSERGPRSTLRAIRSQRGFSYTRFRSDDSEQIVQPISCESLGPGLLSNAVIARFWDRVVLTDSESKAVETLGLVLGDTLEGVTMVGDDVPRRLGGRRAIAKLERYSRPVPLKSLGDGALRLFSAALALANSRDGFLVIDEAENGIHHSVQRGYWRMVLQAAQDNNVQVVATTHSWDCVRGFAQAATELEDVEGALVRLERRNGDLRAVEYSEEQLQVAAEQGIEVR